ncbi:MULTISPECIES: DMT family transporter [Alphaproteobacteria]|uniref:Membrane protein n=2 Tax=Alphaproteobacteria TaxID=28211 RepID=A0A512HJB9_9HYPH|nr:MULTISPECIES: DMT family transporter [Alphaproteobacteria]GEO85531.1 membrane protein [Ciceribacter naphthalenivorans]GLR21447.1 membrane protein [Ciceribacter naphthalenivorans]GLT04303.1 membrane protein [Sphingomonas psychrolutea]
MKSDRAGYLFALATYVIFASQDAISKHLGQTYSPVMITMIRYWAFGAFAVALAMRAPGGLRVAVKSSRLWLQIFRGVLLATQIATAIFCFWLVGLAHSQAIFAATPLLVAALSVPVLGEHVGWRRWLAIGAGFIGVLVILKPDAGIFDPVLLLAVLNAFMLAGYALATRLVARNDPPMTSFFYIGVVGAVAMTFVGPFFWEPMARADWGWMAALCCTGMVSHYCLIKALDHLDAVLVQPFSYLHLVMSCFIGVLLFGEVLGSNVVIGSLIVVGAGVFTVWREIRAKRIAAVAGG